MVRPFSILGIQQIAIGAADKAKLNRLWVDLLGITVMDSYRSENENINEDTAQRQIQRKCKPE